MHHEMICLLFHFLLQLQECIISQFNIIISEQKTTLHSLEEIKKKSRKRVLQDLIVEEKKHNKNMPSKHDGYDVNFLLSLNNAMSLTGKRKMVGSA